MPEQLLSTRRAEAKKREDALARVRARLEEHEKLLCDVQAQGEGLRQELAVEAEAFRQAELALQEAQCRVAASSAHAVAPPSRVAPSLSERGAAAMQSLEAHLAALSSPDCAKLAEEEYQVAATAARQAGEEPPSLIAFILKRLGGAGADADQIIKTELACAACMGEADAKRAPSADAIPTADADLPASPAGPPAACRATASQGAACPGEEGYRHMMKRTNDIVAEAAKADRQKLAASQRKDAKEQVLNAAHAAALAEEDVL